VNSVAGEFTGVGELTLSVDNRFLRKTIEKALKDLPALPAVVTRVLQETEQPNASAAQVERLICTDQALTMKVLRVVNSAYYGLSGQVTSLSQAVVILGMQQIRNLVLSVGAVSTLQVRTARQHETLKQFWLHSFGSAAATQIIAKKKGLPGRDAETAFIGGLLHDIGRLFLFCNFTEIYDDLLLYAEQRGIPVEEAEVTFLGLSHSQVGEEMAKTWRLPSVLASIIGHHEGPFEEGDEPMELAVHVGDFLTKHIYCPPDAMKLAKVDPVAMAWLGASTLEFDQLRQATEEKLAEASVLFGLLSAA